MKMTKNKASVEMEVDDCTASICRLCAEMISSTSFIPLYTPDKQEQTVTKQINQLIANLISPNDGLPQEVCLQCAENVAKYFAFVTNIIETQNKLRRVIQLPEIKKLNRVTDNQSQFLQNVQSENVTAVDYDSQKSGISRLNESNKNCSPKENVTRTPERGTTVNNRKSERTTDIEDRSKIEILSEKTIRTVDGMLNIEPFQSSRPTIKQRSNSSCLRLYRCGLCFEKFKLKEDCLRHIVQKHPQVKKPVSPNTIFEMVYKNLDEDKRLLNVSQLKTFRMIPQKSDVLHPPVLNQTSTPQVNMQNGSCRLNLSNKNVTSQENLNKNVDYKSDTVKQSKGKTSSATNASNKNVPKRPGGPRRKVLCIDSFYKEVRKRCIRYKCDVCGRIMVSEFAFERHLTDHDASAEDNAEEARAEKPRPSTLNKPRTGYCKRCKRNVSSWSRHVMYHAISRLEKRYPDAIKLLKSSS